MNKEVIIRLKLNDRNRNFNEILNPIKIFCSERDGVDEVKIFNEVKHE